jgi:hypothetical protein
MTIQQQLQKTRQTEEGQRGKRKGKHDRVTIQIYTRVICNRIYDSKIESKSLLFLTFSMSQALVIRRLIPGGLGRNSALFRHVGEGFAVRTLAKMARRPVRAMPGQVSLGSNSIILTLYNYMARTYIENI